MKAYLKELPGRVHDYKEDSACSSFLTDAEGKDWGLFMVADGLSGYKGDTAERDSYQLDRFRLQQMAQAKPFKTTEDNQVPRQVLRDEAPGESRMARLRSQIVDWFKDDPDQDQKIKKSDEGKNKS